MTTLQKIDFAQFEKFIESSATVLPFLATFIPQVRLIMPYIPVLEGLIKMADELEHATTTEEIQTTVSLHLHQIADQVKVGGLT